MRAMNDRDLNIWCDVSTALRDAADLDDELAKECAEAILPVVHRILAMELREAAAIVEESKGIKFHGAAVRDLHARADDLHPTTAR